MPRKGKCHLLDRLLPHKKAAKNSVVDYPPPPYSKDATYANMTYYPPMGMGVAANYIPGTADKGPKSGKNKEGFNVWYIQGATGFVGMPENSDPSNNLGRLETMNMCLRGKHDFDITKMPKYEKTDSKDADSSDESDESSDDEKDKKKKKKAKAKAKAKAKKDADDSDEDIPKPPAPPTKSKKPVCNVCHGDKKKETRKIKGDGVICWPCLWFRYQEKATDKWLEAE